MRTISLNVFASATTTNLDSPLISSNNKSLCTVHHIDLPLPFYRCSIRSIKTFRRADTRSRRIPPTATTSNHANGLTRHARWKVPVVTRPRRVLLLEQPPPLLPEKIAVGRQPRERRPQHGQKKGLMLRSRLTVAPGQEESRTTTTARMTTFKVCLTVT